MEDQSKETEDSRKWEKKRENTKQKLSKRESANEIPKQKLAFEDIWS